MPGIGILAPPRSRQKSKSAGVSMNYSTQTADAAAAMGGVVHND